MYFNEEAIYNNDNKKAVYVVLMHCGTVLGNAIRKITSDEFSHSCISFNSKLDPLYSFGVKPDTMDKSHGSIGFVINNPSDNFFLRYKSNFRVYVMYVSNDSYRLMKERLEYFTKNKDNLKYDFRGLIDIYFGKDSEDHAKYFCSRFVMEIINKGMELAKVPSLWRPNEIMSLSNISLVNQGTDFSEYNYRKTDKNCKMIKIGDYDERKILL